MNNVRMTMEKIFKGAVRSFSRFPAAILSAIVISIIAIVRINMNWDVQKPYILLFDSIQIAFLLGAVFSMAAVALEEIRYKDKKRSFIIANASGIVLAIITFLLLYFFGGIVGEDNIDRLSSISMARAVAGVFISIVAFIYIVSKAKAVGSFSNSFFIIHRAFIIAAIYGLVIMIGSSGVVGAFEALVYRNLNSNIYGYIGVIVGFLTYTIFLGYFPTFREVENEMEIKRIEEEPRFIFVLFEYILIPILIALTVVLLIWSVRVMLRGVEVSFNQLSGISSSYVIIGIWLHIMVAKHKTKLAEFYKRAYPFAGILILIFEAWALFVQLNKSGIKTTEYSFLMIWIFAMVSVLMLIFLKDGAYRKIAITSIVIAIIWVLPVVGCQDITFNSQANRLQKTLKVENILVDEKIVIIPGEVEDIKKAKITDGVDFIAYSEKKNLPKWFKKDLNDEGVFKDTFGFEKTYGIYDDINDNMNENFTNTFRLKEVTIDISEYNFSLNTIADDETDIPNSFQGKDGTYQIIMLNEEVGVPKILVKLNDKIIIEENVGVYIDKLILKYPVVEKRDMELGFEDMNLVLENDNISILFVFNNIDIYHEDNGDQYYVGYQGVYIKEK